VRPAPCVITEFDGSLASSLTYRIPVAKGYLPAGRSVTYRFGVTSPASWDDRDSTVSRWLVDVWSGGPKDAMYRDRAPENNRKIFSITRR
jgi:hypothetical protein